MAAAGAPLESREGRVDQSPRLIEREHVNLGEGVGMRAALEVRHDDDGRRGVELRHERDRTASVPAQRATEGGATQWAAQWWLV